MEHKIKRGEKGFYIGEEAKPLAEIIFEETPTQFIIEHTGVDPSLSGQGIGKKLVNLVTDEAKKANKAVISYCSFADKILAIDATNLSWNIKK